MGRYGRHVYRGYLRSIDRWGLTHLKGSPLLIGILGLMVSYLGSLPVGVLNTSSLYWSTTAGLGSSLQFVLAVVLIEGLWAYGALYFSGKLKIEGHWKTGMLLVTFLLLSYLSWSTFHRATPEIGLVQEKATLVSFDNPWIMGLALSAMNPFQVPFWLLWHHFFKEQGWLTEEYWNKNSYVFGIVLGTFLALGLYALLGYYLQSRLQDVLTEFQRILALVFALFALYFAFAGYKHLKNQILME